MVSQTINSVKDGAFMNKAYAIFDMDGTLVDSMGYWQSLEREFLIQKGVTEGIDEILERTKPMTLEEASTLFIETFHMAGTPAQLADEIHAIMEGHYRHDVLPKPGAKEYLDRLRDRGVKMCVASATPAPLIRLCLERLGLCHYFDFILSCVDVGAGKSRPDVYLECARRLDAKPGEIAVFEDAVYAVRSSKAAGFYVVGVQDRCNTGFWEEIASTAHETVGDWNLAE